MLSWTGAAAEKTACHYLMKQGLQHLASNYRSRLGEIDLIMQDGLCLVFVEVRKRSSMMFGGAIESITRQKQRKIIKTASQYLVEQRWAGDVRFDVVVFENGGRQPEWIKHAFE